MLIAGLVLSAAPTGAQNEQRVTVTIKDFTFVAQAAPLVPGIPTIITIANQDDVRHDFGSHLLQGGPTEVEANGVITYGRGVEGLFLNPSQTAMIRVITDRPGRYEFRCSIHPTMRGELLLLNIGAV
jgi:hypothetical protein